MNSKEIILANINHEDPPRPGLDFDRNRISDFLYADLKPYNYHQKRWLEGDREYYDDEWGNIWHRMTTGSQKGEIYRPFVKDWNDLDCLQTPDYTHPDCAKEMNSLFKQPTDKFKIAIVGGWIFDNARYIRDMSVYFFDMAANPDELNRLHGIISEVYEQKIHLAGKNDADGIFLGEDMGTQTGLLFSPKMFRYYFKSEYARLFSIAHDYGLKVFMHSCGKNWAILPDLLEIGVDVFQFDQPAVYNMPELSDLLQKHKAALFSPIDIQKILPTGDRSIIESGALKMFDIFKGGLIFKNYLDLSGIGVKEEWDDWAYHAICDQISKNLPGFTY
ncbi:MAG: uroporphyrinogen decarboxylase family protein [Anaerolineaceae bacterium]|nr:uroporphyrinogen decarboxylase family protein [Anaerolineaceae bacterium]